MAESPGPDWDYVVKLPPPLFLSSLTQKRELEENRKKKRKRGLQGKEDEVVKEEEKGRWGW